MKLCNKFYIKIKYQNLIASLWLTNSFWLKLFSVELAVEWIKYYWKPKIRINHFHMTTIFPLNFFIFSFFHFFIAHFHWEKIFHPFCCYRFFLFLFISIPFIFLRNIFLVLFFFFSKSIVYKNDVKNLKHQNCFALGMNIFLSEGKEMLYERT